MDILIFLQQISTILYTKFVIQQDLAENVWFESFEFQTA